MSEADKPSRGRVVVVDDDAPQRRLMAMQLEEEGFEVTTYANGEECLERAAAFDPDVILLDINMPGLNGIDTCRRMKEQPELQSVPVVFITGQSDDDPTTVEALRAGGNDFISKDASQPVLLTRVTCQVTIRRSQRQMHKMAMTDELTGLFSRRFLFEALRRSVKSSTRARPDGVACLVTDLDHFKAINDTHGHLKGDEALRQVADTIRRVVRETDVVSRFGGEEFVVVLPDTDMQSAAVVAEKIRLEVHRSCMTTISIGVAYLEPLSLQVLRSSRATDTAVETLLKRADTAMYASKHAGRNRVTLWEEALSSHKA